MRFDDCCVHDMSCWCQPRAKSRPAHFDAHFVSHVRALHVGVGRRSLTEDLCLARESKGRRTRSSFLKSNGKHVLLRSRGISQTPPAPRLAHTTPSTDPHAPLSSHLLPRPQEAAPGRHQRRQQHTSALFSKQHAPGPPPPACPGPPTPNTSLPLRRAGAGGGVLHPRRRWWDGCCGCCGRWGHPSHPLGLALPGHDAPQHLPPPRPQGRGGEQL